MGWMVLWSLLGKQSTDDLGDILPSRHDEMTLPMLGAAFFERGLVCQSHIRIQPFDSLALGDVGYLTEASDFVVVDNVHHRLQSDSGTLSWSDNLQFFSGKEDLGDTPPGDIVSKGGSMYHRRRQVYYYI
jgi:hypothetical protein